MKRGGMAVGVENADGTGGAIAAARAGLSERYRGVVVRVASVAVTLAVWEWYGRGVDPIFFSYPTAIFAAVPKMLASGELQAAFWISVQVARCWAGVGL